MPVRTIIYRDDDNDPNSAITIQEARGYVDNVNNIFFNANTGIQFFIQFEDIIDYNSFRSEINSDADVAEMFLRNNQRGVMNIHFIRNNDGSEEPPGSAVNPLKINISPKFNCYVRTHGTLSENPNNLRSEANISNTLAHELGHTLGLLHTHHPGRVALFNEENAEIGNNCFQEYVSRSAKNNQINCLATNGNIFAQNDGEKKCEINGDFLCDTKADPRLSNSRVNPLTCEYEYSGDENYERDNSGKA